MSLKLRCNNKLSWCRWRYVENDNFRCVSDRMMLLSHTVSGASVTVWCCYHTQFQVRQWPYDVAIIWIPVVYIDCSLVWPLACVRLDFHCSCINFKLSLSVAMSEVFWYLKKCIRCIYIWKVHYKTIPILQKIIKIGPQIFVVYPLEHSHPLICFCHGNQFSF